MKSLIYKRRLSCGDRKITGIHTPEDKDVVEEDEVSG